MVFCLCGGRGEIIIKNIKCVETIVSSEEIINKW